MFLENFVEKVKNLKCSWPRGWYPRQRTVLWWRVIPDISLANRTGAVPTGPRPWQMCCTAFTVHGFPTYPPLHLPPPSPKRVSAWNQAEMNRKRKFWNFYVNSLDFAALVKFVRFSAFFDECTKLREFKTNFQFNGSNNVRFFRRAQKIFPSKFTSRWV